MVNVDDIAAEIRLLIDKGELPVGERLPAERKLCELLGVSRGYVRKALSKLEQCGAIDTRPQSGSYVVEHFFASLVQARIFLETECIRLSALNRTAEDLAAMESAMNDFAENDSVDLHTPKDMCFHSAVARGSHNPVLVALLKTVSMEVVTYYHKYNVCNVADPVVISEHEALFKAIRSCDPDAAVAVFRKHMERVVHFSENCSF